MLPVFARSACRRSIAARLVVAGLLVLTIIGGLRTYVAANSLECSAVKVGVRRCLNNMIIAGTYTPNAEALVRSDITAMQRLWGLSARDALYVECGQT